MEFENPDIDLNQRVQFIKKCHLFRGLTDEQLNEAADALEQVPYQDDQMVIKQGSQGDYFFMVYSGSVSVTRNLKGIEEELATLVVGDYFGEEALITHHNRTASVTTLEDCVFLALARPNLDALLAHNHKLKTNFEVAVESRRLIRATNFDWIQPDEVIYFLARKHPILLWESLAGPILALLLPILLFWFFISTGAIIPLIFACLSLLADTAWGVWQWVDWGNDYFIVTNKRAIWLEKVIGIYDSRQEAPLKTILSVGVETDQIGRMLDYGDVIVRTFVGRILFHHVHRPYLAASLVEEHWIRTREISRTEDAGAMKDAIRERLGLQSRQPGQPAKEAPVMRSPYKPGVLHLMFSNVFKVRFEDSGTITYRKHWFVLLTKIWQSTLILILLLAGIIYRLFNLPVVQASVTSTGASVDTLIIILLILFGLAFLWWLYQYTDWHNDIFQVTPEQIFDIDKTPLGREERRAAPLDNILSTESKRIGLLQVLFNYGNVYISVGGSELVFEDVVDPPSVQQDIDQRRSARIAMKKDAEARLERERMADWIAAYHRDSDSLRMELGKDDLEIQPDDNE
jgi:hypothetical protein